jgi:hypothetical protein
LRKSAQAASKRIKGKPVTNQGNCWLCNSWQATARQ